MKDEAYKEIFKNTSISGIMYKNGTWFSFNTNDRANDTVDMVAGQATISVKLKNENGKSYGFLTNGIAIDFNQNDTT